MKRDFLRFGRAGPTAIVVGAVALIAMIWLGSIVALRANRAEVEAHAAAEIANDSLLFADRMNEHISAIDQALRFLERDWEADPGNLDLQAWRQRAVVLSDPALQICITDANGIIDAATSPALIGKSLADRPFFRNRASLPADDGKTYIGQAARRPDNGPWAVNMVRRLDLPDGSFAGVISVSYEMDALLRYYANAGLGEEGLILLLGGSDDMIRAAEGGHARPGQDIAGSAMAAAIARTPDGRWIGPSATDGVVRVHAFDRLPDHDLEIVLGESEANAVSSAIPWEREALAFACIATVLVLVLAGALLAEARAARRQLAVLAHERAMLAAAKADAEAKSQRLEVTLSGMSDGVMMMDADLRLAAWNDRFPELIGLPAAMLARGMPLADVLRAQAAAGEFGAVDVETEVARRIAAIRASGDAVSTERTRPNGREIAVHRQRIADGSFVTLYSDITEIKHREEALRQARFVAEATSEAKSRFVAMVSHEIRQPLNALLNSLSLLAGNEMAPAPRRLVDMAQQAGNALLGLLNDILEMSKMEAGQLTMRPEAFALRPMLQSVLDMFADQAAARGMTLALAVADGMPERITADPVRIRQILMNLLSNAVKFAAAGRIVLAAEPERDMPQMLRLTIRDPGPAIDPAGRARLFQPFVQLGDSTAGTHAGTGLGLAICQTLAALLGGEIGYDPAEDGGNAFWVRIAFTEPAASPEPLPTGRPLYPRSRVLLVEDMRANQLVLATMLRREGHMVDVVSSGSAAIRAVARQPYDLVLMDIFMPGMTGIEATRHIRALPGPGGRVPICALTGNVSAEDRARCEAVGMNDVLVKPTELTALLAVIGRLVWPNRPVRALNALPGSQGALPAAPLLLPARLAELRANLAPEVLPRLVEQSIDEQTERLALLRHALAAGDSATVASEAHAMAGMAGNYAMEALATRLHRVADAARRVGAAEAGAVAGDLEDLLALSAAALRCAVQDVEAAAQ